MSWNAEPPDLRDRFSLAQRSILKSLVRVVYGMLTSPALPESHLQCRHGVLMPHVIGNLPSHYFLRIGIRNQKQIVKCILIRKPYICCVAYPQLVLCHQARSLSVDPDRPSFRDRRRLSLSCGLGDVSKIMPVLDIEQAVTAYVETGNSLRQPVLHLSDSGKCRKIFSYRANAFQDAVFVNGIIERPFEKAYHACLVTPSNPHASLTLRSRDMRKRMATVVDF